MTPIRWGILATGNIARKLAHDIDTMEDAVVAAVGSRSQAAANTFAEEFGVPHAYGSYDALIYDPNVDVIYVATPNHLHYQNTMACLRAGKPVLCEKPFALNARQAQEMIDYAERHNLFVMEAIWSRFIPAHRKLYELAWTGALGEIRAINAEFGFRAQFDPVSRLFDPSKGGGALLDLGVYALALAVKLLGTPDRVTGFAQLSATNVDEQVAIILGFPSGAVANITCAIRTQLSNDARIYGTKGRARLHEPFWRPNDLTTVIDGVEEHLTIPRQNWGYQHELEEVHRCLREGHTESPQMPHDDTLTIARIMDDLRRQWGVTYPGD